MYHSDQKKLKLGHSFKFTIDGKRLIPIDSVKYLGVLLDEHMSWNQQIYQVKLKLNRAMGILSKLRSHANFQYLKNCILFTLSISSAIWCITMGPEKSGNQTNKAEIPKSCSQKN